jgi:hypothetical protein
LSDCLNLSGNYHLGLRNILFFAEKYPNSFAKFANLNHNAREDLYPFAITCFNITMMALLSTLFYNVNKGFELICMFLGYGIAWLGMEEQSSHGATKYDSSQRCSNYICEAAQL